MMWDRDREQKRIRELVGTGTLGYITGRRRIGKTALLTHVSQKHRGFYHQAVEGTPLQQLTHLVEEWQYSLPLLGQVIPKSWSEFFSLISREPLPPLVVFDEFSYWVAGDPTLPSVLQKWVDHDLPKQKTLLLISGSTQSMLHSLFGLGSAPLYGRALLHLDLRPLSFKWFCKAKNYSIGRADSFIRYALVGGIPHYWNLMPKGTPEAQADALFFRPSALLADEPRLILHDEGVTGGVPKALLDLIGRGVSKPSELAARIGTPQGNLSRPLALLLELGLAHRDLPFGESLRSTKKVLYAIEDPTLSFYYGVATPNRARWPVMSANHRKRLLWDHASRQWERFCRRVHPGGLRYWEGDVELDVVAPHGTSGLLVAECKWKQLTAREHSQLLGQLEAKYRRTRLAAKYPKPVFRIFGPSNLEQLADLE